MVNKMAQLKEYLKDNHNFLNSDPKDSHKMSPVYFHLPLITTLEKQRCGSGALTAIELSHVIKHQVH